jgi:signal transduction histidine kinase
MLSLSKIAAASRQVEAAEKYSPNYIRVVLGASVVLHSILSVMHFLVLPLSSAFVIAPWQIASAIVSLVVLLVHLRDPERLSVRIIFLLLCSLVLFNTALRLGVSHDPKQSTNFGICIICMGLTLSRWSDFLALTTLTIVLWALAVGHPSVDNLVHYGLFLVEALAVAALIVGRRRLISLRSMQHRAAERMALEKAEDLAQSYRLAAEKAETANIAKAKFLANMSHELRTPLNAIIGFSEILKDFGQYGFPESRRQEYASDIERSGRFLLSLITEILEYSRAEAGKSVLHEAVMALDELADEIRVVLQPLAAKRGVELTVDGASNLHLYVDAIKLKQILLNLGANAIKFTPSGGHVRIGSHCNHEGVVLEVRDDGIGIPAVMLDKVLEPFVQVENEFSRTQSGTGLGLPLTKQLIELHGGTLELLSTEGEGTTARAIFPTTRIVREVADRAVA